MSDEGNPEDMEKTAPDHSADALRYVLAAANQGQHNFRPRVKGTPHPLKWPAKNHGGVNTGVTQ